MIDASRVVIVDEGGGYWSLCVDGVRLVERESFAIVERIRDRVLRPELDDTSEATEVARSIRRDCEGW